MATVSHMTNEIRQMLYNFGYRAKFEDTPDGRFGCTLSEVDGALQVTGRPQASRFEAIVQAYLCLLSQLNPGQTPPTSVVSIPLDHDSPSDNVTDRLVESLGREGYEATLERDRSGYGWRGAMYRHGKPVAFTDYAATKFDALTHAMGYLVEHLEAKLDPSSAVATN